jgi:hypothetical protein
MRYEFATLFDRRYLPRGLVLYRSLRAHCAAFRLHVFCIDSETKSTLEALDLPSAVIIGLDELEEHDPALRSVRPKRSPIEYLWTARAAICRFVLERDSAADHVVYLDVDLEFYADPAPIFEELGDGSVLLTPHRSAPEFANSPNSPEKTGGRFNGQFVVFRRDEHGLAALRWWHERCIEWCYDRIEPTRYANQKYLDDLPARFSGVRSAAHPGAGLAPWNVSSHRVARSDGRVLIDGEPLIFHHFQSLHLHRASRAARMLARTFRAYRLTEGPVPLVWTTGWRLREEELSTLWDPYVARLSDAAAELAQVSFVPVADGPLRPSRVAFHILRGRLPGPARSLYWQARSAIWRRRS